VYRVPIKGGTKGLYALRPDITSGDDQSPVILEGIDLTDQDMVSPVSTVENFKVLYVFGTDYGQVRISGLCLLGAVDGANSGQAFGAVIDYFQKNRVSASRKPISISMPGSKAYNVYLTGLAIGQPDAAFNIQPFALIGLIAGSQ
jgi:hypothetical protein